MIIKKMNHRYFFGINEWEAIKITEEVEMVEEHFCLSLRTPSILTIIHGIIQYVVNFNFFEGALSERVLGEIGNHKVQASVLEEQAPDRLYLMTRSGFFFMLCFPSTKRTVPDFARMTRD